MITEQQRKDRQKGIGSSEAAIIMGDSSFMTLYELWMIKTGKMDAPDLSQKPEIIWGNLLEDDCASYYEMLTGEKLDECNNTLVHDHLHYMLCHPDRTMASRKKLVEIKTGTRNDDKWGLPGSDMIPDEYMWQIQHQLAVTGFEEADLAVFFSRWDFRIYTIKRDDILIKALEDNITHFWCEYVLKNMPPPLTGKHDVKLAYPRNNGNLKEIDLSSIAAIEKLKDIKKNLRDLERLKDKLEDEIALSIRDSDGLCIDNMPLVTWKADKNNVRRMRILT